MVSFTALPAPRRMQHFTLPLRPPLVPTPTPAPAPHPVPFRLYCHFQRHASTFVDPRRFCWLSSRCFLFASVCVCGAVVEQGTTTETIIQKYKASTFAPV